MSHWRTNRSRDWTEFIAEQNGFSSVALISWHQQSPLFCKNNVRWWRLRPWTWWLVSARKECLSLHISSQLPSRAQHSSLGSTNFYLVRGLSLDHQFCFHFNGTIKSKTRLKHSKAYRTGPKCWLMGPVQQTRGSNWQQQNCLLVHECCAFCSHWSILV